MNRPAPAFLAGLASHFLLDAIPHWAIASDHATWLQYAQADGVTAVVVIGAIAILAPKKTRVAMLAGAAGATLPDIDKPLREGLGIEPWPAIVNHLHSHIQHESLANWPIDASVALVAGIATLVIVTKHRWKPADPGTGRMCETPTRREQALGSRPT